MNKTISAVITDILTYHNAVVEQREDGSLELLSPPEISKILNIPEYTKLSFSSDGTSNDGVYASYDSEFFSSIKELFANGERFSLASSEPYYPNKEKLTKIITEKITFQNATFRLNRIEDSPLSFLLFIFKYIALSDEKQEGVLAFLVNELNQSLLFWEEDIDELIGKLKRTDSLDQSQEHGFKNDGLIEKTLLKSAYIAATGIIKEKIADFIKSIERRLNRDIKRVYDYYETLKDETKRIIEQKKNVENSDERVRILSQKIETIDMEQKGKIQDLVAKYTVNIRLEPVSLIRIETQSFLFWINIKRRSACREFPLAYNPISRRLDILPCEVCFNPKKGYYICEDKLHIVCGNCFAGCLHCGKQFCRICQNICPKCKK